jgi:hypothetical protein
MTSAPHEDRVAWVTELTGHEIDLEDLAHWTSGNAYRVLKASVKELPDKYHLRLPISLVGMDHKEVRQRAEQVMVTLNGLGAMLVRTFEGVQFSNAMNTVDGSGQRRDVVVSVQGTSIRTAMGRLNAITNGQAIADATKGVAAQILAEADGSDAVHDALILVGRLTPTWSELYVAYELVETNDASPMYSDGWAEKAALALFKRTANSRTALGVHARHGEEATEPPPKPMAHEDAVGLIRTLVYRWVSYRIEKK